MNLIFKFAIFPALVVGVTLFGLAATSLSRLNPSPTAMIGAPLQSPAIFFLYDGPSVLN